MLQRTNSIKNMGLTVDSKVNWDKHVQQVWNITIPIIADIRRCIKMPRHAESLIFEDAHIISKIKYVILVKYHSINNNVTKIKRVMTKSPLRYTSEHRSNKYMQVQKGSISHNYI